MNLISWLRRTFAHPPRVYEVSGRNVVTLLRTLQDRGEWSPSSYPKPQPEKATNLRELMKG